MSDPAHEAEYNENWQTLPQFGTFLYERACKQFGAPTLPSEVCWFHCTRVPPGTTFEEGLLPLGQRIVRLKASIIETVPNTEDKRLVEEAFEREGGLGFHFRSKLTMPLHWGPYAILVREVAMHANKLGQHDYLAVPEIIDDLCDEVQNVGGRDLLAVFEARWRPAIVKFTAPAGNAAFYLGVALCYLRGCALEGCPVHGAVACFDGANVPVRPERVIGVEYV